MQGVGLIIFIVAVVVAIVIVNKAQQLYMKLMGADMMFFSGKAKLFAIIIVALILAGLVYKLFGIV